MNITDVRVKKLSGGEGKPIAVAAIAIDGALVVHDVKIFEGSKGRFLAFPSHQMHDGSFKDLVHPISAEVRKEFEDAVFKEYDSLGDRTQSIIPNKKQQNKRPAKKNFRSNTTMANALEKAAQKDEQLAAILSGTSKAS